MFVSSSSARGPFKVQRYLSHTCVCKSFNTVSSHLKCSFDRIKNNDCARKIVATCLNQWERSSFVFRTILRRFSPPPKAWQRIVLRPNNVQIYVRMYTVTHDDREKREIKHVYHLPLSVYTRYFPGLFLSSGRRIIISGIVHVYTARTQLDLWAVCMCVLLRSVKRRFTTGHQSGGRDP